MRRCEGAIERVLYWARLGGGDKKERKEGERAYMWIDMIK